MSNRGMGGLKIKKEYLIAIVCFLFAALFLITSVAPRKIQEQRQKTETETQTADVNEPENVIQDPVDSTDAGKSQESVKQEEQEPDIGTEPDYPVYQDGFEVVGVPEELLTLVGSDVASLSESLQETFYQNGFYDYTKAEFLDSAELDYGKNTLTLTLIVRANEDRNVTAVYYRDAREWLVQIW